MKTIFKLLYALAMSIFLWTTAAGQVLRDASESLTFAIEIDGVLCGYAESKSEIIEKNGVELLSLENAATTKFHLLGGNVDASFISRYEIDLATQRPVVVERSITTTAEMYARSEIENGYVRFTDRRGGAMKKIELEPDVILENSGTYPHLMKDFIVGNETEKSYKVFDDMRGFVATKNYKKIGEEELTLAEERFNTTVFEELNQNLGITCKLWLNTENSFLLKINVAGNREIYLADKSVKKHIQTVDLNNTLLAKVNIVISNVPDISQIKVEAKISSGGEWITSESLNFPGQKFEGTVTNNLINGVFEIEKQHFTGENAPSFPAQFSDEKLQKYLEPESLIESDHPDLIAEANRISKDSKDSWEAVVKLSTWVGENIHGAIPGGTSAINTYNTREGECGSHSRLLAAFCRAVGIPARLSIGCMYIPYLGGSFGQHAWTEVYMGDAGWVAVDATAHEFDFVDAGHIRLGEKTSFHPKEMKILDYKMGNGELTTSVPEELQKYIGKYLHEERNSTFEIRYQDGSLAIEIPGGQVLALNPPNKNGVLYPKMTRQLNFSFENDIYGNIAKMKLQQVIPLGKKFEQDSIGVDVPGELKPLLGNYWLAPAQADFKVIFENGMLALNDPLAKKIVKLPQQTDAGFWKDEFGKNEIEFVKNSDGEVTRMLIYSNVFLQKQIEL